MGRRLETSLSGLEGLKHTASQMQSRVVKEMFNGILKDIKEQKIKITDISYVKTPLTIVNFNNTAFLVDVKRSIDALSGENKQIVLKLVDQIFNNGNVSIPLNNVESKLFINFRSYVNKSKKHLIHAGVIKEEKNVTHKKS